MVKKSFFTDKYLPRILVTVAIVALVSLVLSLVAVVKTNETVGRAFGFVALEDTQQNSLMHSVDLSSGVSVDMYSSCLANTDYGSLKEELLKEKGLRSWAEWIKEGADQAEKNCHDAAQEAAQTKRSAIAAREGPRVYEKTGVCRDTDGALDFDDEQRYTTGRATDLTTGLSLQDVCVPGKDAIAILRGNTGSYDSARVNVVKSLEKQLLRDARINSLQDVINFIGSWDVISGEAFCVDQEMKMGPQGKMILPPALSGISNVQGTTGIYITVTKATGMAICDTSLTKVIPVCDVQQNRADGTNQDCEFTVYEKDGVTRPSKLLGVCVADARAPRSYTYGDSSRYDGGGVCVSQEELDRKQLEKDQAGKEVACRNVGDHARKVGNEQLDAINKRIKDLEEKIAQKEAQCREPNAPNTGGVLQGNTQEPGTLDVRAQADDRGIGQVKDFERNVQPVEPQPENPFGFE